MALVDTTWYVNFGNGTSTGYYAVTVRPQNTAVAAGVLRRQFTAPAVGSERVFVCIVAGTTANVTDATWVLTRGAKTTDGTATWMECTGQAALNGDLTNTATWAQVKAATPAVLGQIIKRSNGASYQICTTAGAMSASEPAFSDTAGVTTTDTTAVWTSLGAVSNFTGGQAPHARLANACTSTWFASGNTVYVGHNHAETQSTNITINPSSALMTRILCHTSSGPYPPTALTTGATVSTTGNTLISVSSQGSFYFYGIAFQAGVSAASSGQTMVINGATAVGQVQNWMYFDNCSFVIAATGATCYMQHGGGQAASWCVTIFNNTTVKFANTAQIISLNCGQLLWQNTGQILAAGSSVPAALFRPAAVALNTVVLEALDLSQLTGNLFDTSTAGSMGNLTVKDCKLNASTSIAQSINTSQIVQLSRSDSGATTYKSARYAYEGTETTETSIVRSGGYSDPTGQVQSRKITTTANAQWLRPFKAQPLSTYNGAVGSSRTLTMYGTVNAGVLPQNDDIWLEVNYLGSGSSPLGSMVTTGKANDWSADAAVASDSSSWASAIITFDAATVTNTTLSNGNLTATHNTATANSGARVLTTIDVGKYYFEFTVVAMVNNSSCVGLLLATGTYTDMVSSGTNSTYIARGGAVQSNNAATGKTVGTCATSDVIGVAVDLTARLAWFRRNAGNWNGDVAANPATGAGGVTVAAGSFSPVVGFGAALNEAFTANFGATSYANAAPSGFGNWGTCTPFKLVATLTPNLPGYIIPIVKVGKASATYYIDPAVVVI